MYNLLLISPSAESAKNFLIGLLTKEKITAKNTFYFTPEENGWQIAELRRITKLVNSHFSQKTAFILLDFHLAKEVVQNTFLKTLEEHQESLAIILTTNSEMGVLETVKSRCEIRQIKQEIRDQRYEIRTKKQNNKQIMEILQKAREKKVFLVSAELKLSPSKKREQANDFLDSLLENAPILLREAKDKAWLADKVKKALEAKRLINNNFVDPELSLDQIFL
jgi:DNA polymerase III delta prime subunit